jgi:hypothetical protein
LVYQGVDFDMKRYLPEGRPSWSNEKWLLGMDFPNLPYFIDDDFKLSETNVIHEYISLDGSQYVGWYDLLCTSSISIVALSKAFGSSLKSFHSMAIYITGAKLRSTKFMTSITVVKTSTAATIAIDNA